MKRRKTRGIGIRSKILLPTTVVIFIMCAVMGLNSYQRIKEGLIAMGVEEAQMAAVISTKAIDVGLVEEALAQGQSSSAFGTMVQSMHDIRDDCGIKYLYTLYTDGSNVYYGIDADDSGGAHDIGSAFEVSYQELRSVFDGEMYVQDYIDSTEEGDLISAYMPLTDSNGNVTGVVGCDYDASGVVDRLNLALKRVIQLSAICLFVTLAVLNLIVNRVIRRLRQVDSKIYELVHNEGDLT